MTSSGSAWVCIGGQHEAQSYSPDDMRSLLVAVANKLPKKEEKPCPSTEGLRVFLEHEKGEQELAKQFIDLHVALTRALPEVGKPMMTRVAGLPAPFNTLPYGKVVRIECNTPSPT